MDIRKYLPFQVIFSKVGLIKNHGPFLSQIILISTGENSWQRISVVFEPQFNAHSKKSVIGMPDKDSLWLADYTGFNQLGENNSEALELDQDIFKKNLIDLLMPYDEIDPKICFNAINESFDLPIDKTQQIKRKSLCIISIVQVFLSGLILIIFTLIIKLFV